MNYICFLSKVPTATAGNLYTETFIMQACVSLEHSCFCAAVKERTKNSIFISPSLAAPQSPMEQHFLWVMRMQAWSPGASHQRCRAVAIGRLQRSGLTWNGLPSPYLECREKFFPHMFNSKNLTALLSSVLLIAPQNLQNFSLFPEDYQEPWDIWEFYLLTLLPGTLHLKASTGLFTNTFGQMNSSEMSCPD